MKTKLNFTRMIRNLFVAVFALTASSGLMAQDSKPTDLKDFKVVVEKTEDGIKMQSIKGSAWVNLAFNIDIGHPQAIDQFGMTELYKDTSENDSKLTDFLFTIAKSENGFVLKGIDGTAWTDLSFSLVEDGKQAIDQFGMTELN